MVVRVLLLVTPAMTTIRIKMALQHEISKESIGLLISYRCNLNCSYCYISEKQPKDMTLTRAKEILEPHLMTDGILDVMFMGGETLMAKDVIVPLVEWASDNRWRCKVRFFGGTNGTLLTDDLKRWIQQYKSVFTLGLSYDGIPSSQLHNRGNDNIDVDFFIDTWPGQQIQMTINTETVQYMAEGVIYLLEKGAVVHPNVAFEEREWDDTHILEYGRQLAKLIRYYANHSDKPLVSQFKHNLKEYANCIDHPVEQRQMCGAGDGFQVFDTDGISYPCHILSPLVLRNEKLQTIRSGALQRVTDYSDKGCVGCPYVSACPTCLACNFLYRGSFQKRDSTHCRIMKMEVKAFIKMEVERLKKKDKLTPVDAAEIDAIVKLVDFIKNRSGAVR